MVVFYIIECMEKTAAENKKRLKELQAELKKLQTALAQANKLEGKDAYIDVKVQKKHARFERVRQKDVEDKAMGHFFIKLDITAKQVPVFIPLSIASGKKTAGFMYQIEGTAAGTTVVTDVSVRGEGVSQVTIGTLLYAKVPTGKTATFQIQIAIRGNFGKQYKLVFTRLNYKLQLTEHLYHQYLKEIHSEGVKFS